jgi:tetratricopeptide (TPR) repeat protein
MLAPAWEKAVYRALVAPQISGPELHALVPLSPEAARIASLFEVIRVSLPQRDYERARALTEWLFAVQYDPITDATLLKYRARAEIHLPIADGVAADVAVDHQTLGLLLAELEQNAGNIDRAIEVVEQLEPTTLAAVSLAELYSQAGRWSDVVDLTNGITNADDLTVYLLTQRAVAFRELRHFEAARESFKEALRSRGRSKELLNVALVERGRTALVEGKKTAARKDFERVLASDSAHPEIKELLAASA